MIAMKFGGASLSRPESVKNVVEIVYSSRKEKPVVVLSAMAKTTRSLLLCADEYAAGRKERGDEHLENIREFHLRMAESLLKDEFLTDVLSDIEKYFIELSKSLHAFFAIKEVSPRSQDSVLCYGELLSTLIVESCLRQYGVNSKLLDSRKVVITDNSYTMAKPILNEVEKSLQNIVTPLIDKGFIPVLQGFIGSTKDGVPTTLGFEGSDYTVSIIGSGLKADAIQIWKNVPGVMSADPDIVQNAETVKTLTFSEAEELTFFGAKVLHPLCIEPVRTSGTPVTIRNTNEVNGDFTSIVPDNSHGNKNVKSITCLKNLILLHFDRLKSNDFRSVLSDLEKNCVSICLFNDLHNRIDIVVKGTAGAERFISTHADQNNMSVKRDVAIVTLVGEGIGKEPDIADKVFESLKNSGINYEVFVNSKMSLAYAIDESSADKAVLSFHNAFFPKE